MAQSVYSGLQGHGKSYEVVRSVICKNVAAGRRIVTNVAGLQVDKIKAYAVDKLKADPDKLGDIVSVDNDDVTKPNFFPKENQDNSGCVVQGGDVVIIDECWRWYVTGEKAPDEHLTFFRMHRHFLHPESGQCCDIVLIVQDINDLQRKFRATVEKSYLMFKHKDMGLDNRYLVTVYSGKRQVKSAVIEQFQCQYDPEIFVLYSSYSQGGGVQGKEKQADRRGNIFNRPLIKFGIPLSLLSLVFSSWYLWKFFHPEKPPAVSQSAPQASSSSPKSSGAAPAQTSKPESGVNDRWRLVGSVIVADRVVFLLADASGRIRYIDNPPGYKIGFQEIEVALPTGEFVTRWSGAASSSGLLQGAKR